MLIISILLLLLMWAYAYAYAYALVKTSLYGHCALPCIFICHNYLLIT